jgi:heme A synthase
MSPTTITIIAIAVPVLAYLAALGAARFSDRLSAGLPRRSRLVILTVLVIIYLAEMTHDLLRERTGQAVAHAAALLLWLSMLVMVLREKSTPVS